MHNRHMRSGQALVIVLLVLAVAATVGLSIASRSVNEINLSTTQDDSSQALSAAESGIEAVLNNPNLNTSGPTTLPTPPATTGAANANYSIASKTAFGNTPTIVLTKTALSGEYVTLFLRDVDPATGNFLSTNIWNSANQINVCWGAPIVGGTPVAAQRPSLEATLYYADSGGTFRTSRIGFNPSDASRSNTNGFSTATVLAGNCAGNQYANIVSLFISSTGNLPMVSGTPYFLRLRLLYNDTVAQGIGVTGGASGNIAFPAQGNIYEIQGTAGQTTRRVQVTQHFPVPPGILDNVLFSGGSL